MDVRDEQGGSARRWMTVVAILVAVALLALAIDDTRLSGWLPWLVLAACPLMHLFMHRGHAHRDHKARGDAAETPDPRQPAGGESR